MNKLYKIFIAICLAVSLFSCKSVETKKQLAFQPVQLPEIQAATVGRIKSSLSPSTLSFVYAPKNNNLAFHHKYLGDTIWVSLNEKERQIMTNAINAYLASYKENKLTSANNNKKAFFGQTSCFMEWGLFSVSHYAKPTLRFEYQLIGEKKLPYFIIATATKPALDKSKAQSPAIRIALSPAKCLEFLERNNEKNLSDILDNLIKEFEKFDADFENTNEAEDTASFFQDVADESDVVIDPAEDEFIF